MCLKYMHFDTNSKFEGLQYENDSIIKDSLNQQKQVNELENEK